MTLDSGLPSAPAHLDELALVEALRQGDEAAFAALVRRYQTTMLRLALIYVPSREVAEEVVQESWLGVLKGIGRFEGRSSLKTWIFRILVNRAHTRGVREGRSIPFSVFDELESEAGEPAVSSERFWPPDHPEWPGQWRFPPQSWQGTPEERLLSQETLAYLQKAIEGLPPNQREVITLRDIEGWASDEICNVLAISETNQRVLLHRARSKVRTALEQYLSGG